jgi:hypothetical protein
MLQNAMSASRDVCHCNFSYEVVLTSPEKLTDECVVRKKETSFRLGEPNAIVLGRPRGK